MGSFMAHVYPGMMFVLFGVWHFFSYITLYNKRGVHQHQNVLRSKIEPFLKIVLCAAGMLSECVSAPSWIAAEIGDEDSSTEDWLHLTMYLLFFSTALFDRFSPRYGKNGNTLCYLSYIGAFTLEALLLYGHLHGRPLLDMQCHTLLAYSGFVPALILVYLLHHPSSITASCAYCAAVVVHGLWFCEAGLIVRYPFGPSPWDQDNPSHAMLATAMFVWTVLGVMLAMLVVAGLCDRSRRGREGLVSGTSLQGSARNMEMNSLLDSD